MGHYRLGHGEDDTQTVQFTLKTKENRMTQKIIEVVGTSSESFAKAAANAINEAAKTVISPLPDSGFGSGPRAGPY